jgi:hypothetical protein
MPAMAEKTAMARCTLPDMRKKTKNRQNLSSNKCLPIRFTNNFEQGVIICLTTVNIGTYPTLGGATVLKFEGSFNHQYL